MITVDRSALLKACEIVKPALATKDFIEELCFLWFDGEMVTAYSDTTFGIQAPFKSDLRGGFRGSILLGILNNSNSSEVKIKFEKSGDKPVALVEAGGTSLRLAMFDESKAIHKVPEHAPHAVMMPVRFGDALRSAMISVAPMSSVPDQGGVTLLHDDGVLNVYATDAKTISWARLHVKAWPKEHQRVILPLQFVEELVKLDSDMGPVKEEIKRLEIEYDKAEKAKDRAMLRKLDTELGVLEDKVRFEFHVAENEVMAVTDSGIQVFTRTVESPQPLDFAGVLAGAQKGSQLLSIPEWLNLMLERSAVMLAGQQEQAVDVLVEDNVLRFYAKTFFGELKDSLTLKEHPKDVRLRVNPELIKRALPFCQEIGFSPHSVVMKGGDNFLHLIASYESRGE